MDLATARRESYRAPGALPRVEPASLAEDLARRDFSLNALAVRLDRADWGRLVDTTGGLADLRARRIRVLHPLSFVEDPTRVFRAARFAARLGCRVDPTTRRLALHATPARRLPGPVGRPPSHGARAHACRAPTGGGPPGSRAARRVEPRRPARRSADRDATAPRLGARPSGPGRPRTRRPDRPRPARPHRRERGPRDLDGPARPRAGPAQRDPAGAPGCARARRSPRPGARPGRRIRHTAERAGADSRVGADSCGRQPPPAATWADTSEAGEAGADSGRWRPATTSPRWVFPRGRRSARSSRRSGRHRPQDRCEAGLVRYAG